MATALLILALSCSTAMATVTANDSSVWIGSSDEHNDTTSSTGNNLRLRGGQVMHSHSSDLEATQQTAQHHVSKKPSSDDHPNQQAFVQHMLSNQGCPPTSTCGDVCYVLTISAASDLHSVAIGKTKTPSHHWHDPASFWQAGVCNAKSQCVTVNPFDKHHTFEDLAAKLAEVERECERNVGMASMFLLAKAMEPPAWSCNTGVAYPNALV